MPAPPRIKPPRILAIAGSDSGGGAGIQADIRTITRLGGHAMTAITAITAQNTLGVSAIHLVPPEMVVAQIDAVAGDIGIDAIKIGMIGSAAIAWAVADRLSKPDLAAVPVVFDPVMIATSGDPLADEETVIGFARLLARATVSTPNIHELGVLAELPVGNEIEIGIAAGHLIDARGTGSILATGAQLQDGRVEWPDDGARRSVATAGLLFDFLFAADGAPETHWSGERIDTRHDHGTGCTLSSAIACGLGAGLALPDAIARARAFVRACLEASPGYGAGHGPMGHAAADWPPSD